MNLKTKKTLKLKKTKILLLLTRIIVDQTLDQSFKKKFHLNYRSK